jgi:mRNA-degrading endonuclease RelE of RelBE toxin-antitoxin system
MSDNHKVLITPNAQKQIRSLDGLMLPRVISCLKMLQVDPHPVGVEKLDENPNFWRIMLGNYKIIYTIFAQQKTIVVALVGKRRDVHLEISNIGQTIVEQVAASDNVVSIAATGTRH